jgi:nicotinamide mononucleotide (NMN) deamidase PncC
MLAEKFSARETLGVLMQGTAEHLVQAAQLRTYNLKAWRDIESVLIDHDQQIIVGESFTFGKLANLFSGNTAQKSCLSAAYGWYDPNYKIAVGVPPEFVTNEKIAEPATVIAGAHGLIKHLAPLATIAIATSGWVNNNWLADKADFFSVACVASPSNGASEKALKFKVLKSQNSPIDYARRDLTRELGVTAALYLLADYLGAYLNPESKANILSKLKEYGEISF